MRVDWDKFEKTPDEKLTILTKYVAILVVLVSVCYFFAEIVIF